MRLPRSNQRCKAVWYISKPADGAAGDKSECCKHDIDVEETQRMGDWRQQQRDQDHPQQADANESGVERGDSVGRMAKNDRADGIADHKGEQGVLAADGDMLKKCATIGIPQTPDSVVTTAKWDAKLMAHPQFAICDSDARLAARTLLSVLALSATGSGFLRAIEAKARLAKPTQAMKTKQARQPKPVTAAASGVVAITPPT